MNNFAITAADAVSRRYKSNDPEAIIAQRAIKIKDIISKETESSCLKKASKL